MMRMGLFRREKTDCNECHARFGSYDELVQHARDAPKLHSIRATQRKYFLQRRTGCTT